MQMTYDLYMLIMVHETKYKNVCVFVSPLLENDHYLYVHVGSKYLTKTNNGIVIVLII